MATGELEVNFLLILFFYSSSPSRSSALHLFVDLIVDDEGNTLNFVDFWIMAFTLLLLISLPFLWFSLGFIRLCFIYDVLTQFQGSHLF